MSNSSKKTALVGACALAAILGGVWLLRSAESTAATTDAATRIAALESAIEAARSQIQRVQDRDDVEILVSAYGYYLDKSLWNQLADLFAEDGQIEIGTRGTYIGRERIRTFLHTVYSAAGPKENVLSNHMQLQPVIHVAPDGKTAKARIRLLFQTGRYGQAASWGGGVYENEYVNNGGVWQIKKVKTYTTFVADYVGGWHKSPRQANAAPSTTFPPDIPPGPIVESYPNVYDFPFHYANPVTGRVTELRPEPPAK
jgi:hypothetical protein